MNMLLNEVDAPTGFYDWVDTQTEIPFLCGVQAQGDVLIVPAKASIGAGAEVVERHVDIVPSENGGHAHTLVVCPGTTARIRWDRTGDPNVIARVECNGPVVLTHMEHGGNGMLAGTYEFRRQVEWDGAEERRVAD